MKGLFDELGYTFTDDNLIKKDLTRKSSSSDNNERLEFLGDAILNLYVSEKLIHSYPELSEGKLTRFKATIVSRQNLNLVAEKLRLSDFIKIGKGERLDGNSILGNTLEAIIGAIFLDSDYPNTKEILQRLFLKDFLEIEEESELKDPKSALQEYIQKTYKSLPTYSIQKSSSSEGPLRFQVACEINEANLITHGSGRSKKRAELEAANNMLTLLEKNG